MNASFQGADTADTRYSRVGVADARTVARIRNEFGRWLRTHLTLTEEQYSDVVLAVNEALTNSAEFAYRTFPEAGTVSIDAQYSSATGSLTVVVVDYGAWNEGDPPHRSHTRGRGIQLMRALADLAVIERGSEGTVVQMRFDHCAAVSDSSALSEA